jgi:hypothetical protein
VQQSVVQQQLQYNSRVVDVSSGSSSSVCSLKQALRVGLDYTADVVMDDNSNTLHYITQRRLRCGVVLSADVKWSVTVRW